MSTNKIKLAEQSDGSCAGAVPHEPGGRVTLVSGEPLMTSEQANKTAIYYTPYKHDLVPIYNGSWLETLLPALTLNMDSNSGHSGYDAGYKPVELFL